MIQFNQSKDTSHNINLSLGMVFNHRVLGFLLVLTLVLFLSSFMSHNVLADQTSNRVKTVATVLVKPGDTLWGIAKNYYTSEYESISKYINEIKKSNGLYTEDIHAGRYIIVPHYIDIR